MYLRHGTTDVETHDQWSELIERMRVRLRLHEGDAHPHWQMWRDIVAAHDAKPAPRVRQQKRFDWELAAARGRARREERELRDASQ